MKFGIYCIQDLKSTYMTPTVDQSDATAIRNFDHAVRNAGSILTSHKDDFRLMKLGEFDSDSGEIVPSLPSIVIEGKDIEL